MKRLLFTTLIAFGMLSLGTTTARAAVVRVTYDIAQVGSFVAVPPLPIVEIPELRGTITIQYTSDGTALNVLDGPATLLGGILSADIFVVNFASIQAILTGLPAGVPVSLDFINRQLWRRQQGYGRGGRMKIETDKAHIVSGVRHSKTIGSPIAILLANRDWENWTEALPVEDYAGSADKAKPVKRPRPGHADLAGCLKFNFGDARYVLERASARETTSRVAVGALAKLFLGEFGIEILSHVIAVGDAALAREAAWEEIAALAEKDEVLLNCVDPETEQRMKAEVNDAYKQGDTRGGVFEVVAHGVPAGLGRFHVLWGEYGRLVSASCHLRRQNPEGNQAC